MVGEYLLHLKWTNVSILHPIKASYFEDKNAIVQNLNKNNMSFFRG